MTFATAAPSSSTRLLSSCDPAIPNRSDNEKNRKAIVFIRALCRPHRNASTSSFPLICWTHRGEVATSHTCHLIVKNRAVGSHFPHLDVASQNTSFTLACKMVNLKGMSLHTGSDDLSVMAMLRHSLRSARKISAVLSGSLEFSRDICNVWFAEEVQTTGQHHTSSEIQLLLREPATLRVVLPRDRHT